MPVEFLKRLPGVEASRIKDIIKKAKQNDIRTMVDVCNSDIDKLTAVFGAKGAREVKTFLERKVDLKDLK